MSLINQLMRMYLYTRRGRVHRILEESPVLQKKWFEYLIHTAKDTEWGKRWGYSEINNVKYFKKRVPLTTYEELYADIEKMMLGQADVLWPGKMLMFSKSSGTTNDRSKFLPVSAENLKRCHLQGGHDMMTFWYEQNPNTQMFHKSKGLIMGGSLHRFERNPSVLVGDVSALMVSNLPSIAAPFLCPSKEVALLPDWDRKLDELVKGCINENITNLSGVPTWTVLLFEELLRRSGKAHMGEVFPNFELYNHGGVSFEPYRTRFSRFFPGEKVQYREVYNASEGFFALQSDANSGSMLLLTDNGIYYEFIPMSELHSTSPIVLDLTEVELDKPYALVISSNSGLWRYQIGDVVSFTELNPYRIKIVGRTKQYINVFGEEVSVENADRALAEVCSKYDLIVRDYTVGPRFLEEGQKGGHEWFIEFEGQKPAQETNFALELDQALQRLNSDYQAKRFKSLALEPLHLRVLPSGTFITWLERRGKLGGQHKVPRLSNDRRYLEEIASLLS